MSKAKEAVIELELLNKGLKDSRAMQVNEFNAMEGRMHASNIIDALLRLREVRTWYIYMCSIDYL